MIAKCSCQNCNGNLEFDSEGAGLTIDCPHCGMKTQLYIPQTARSFSGKRAGFYLGIIILAAICFATYRFYLWRTDKLEEQNAIAAIAAKNANEEAQKAADKAKLDNYLFNHRFSKDTNLWTTELSFEEKSSGPVMYLGTRAVGDIIREYKISYENQNCLHIEKKIHVDYMKGMKTGYEAENMDILILRKDLDDLIKWIATYKKWCRTTETEHLADGITNNLARCVKRADEFMGRVDFEWEDIQFVTPNIFQIGTVHWGPVEVNKLERLLSIIPDLDTKLKTNVEAKMAMQAKEEKETANQNQLRLNEENRAKALLK